MHFRRIAPLTLLALLSFAIPALAQGAHGGASSGAQASPQDVAPQKFQDAARDDATPAPASAQANAAAGVLTLEPIATSDARAAGFSAEPAAAESVGAN